jgi:parvulin-like peptidyl-prolyl isomerase
VWSSVATPLEGFPHVTQAVLALGAGEISPVIESIDGFYVLRRLPLVEPPTFAATEIVVAYAGARFSDGAVRPVLRTRDQAKALATELGDQLRAEPRQFDSAVTASSDSPTSKTGGKRTWTKGRSLPAIDAAIERAGIGDIVGPVETALGFSILRRDPAP